ncbi:MAG: hypothetical protein AB7V19_03485 [Candidatus Bipolaricaulia bacterium]
MKRLHAGIAVAVVLCLGAVIAVAQDATTDDAPARAPDENLSEDRTVGVGIQVGSPWGGLISTRYWLSPEMGAEAIIFVDGSGGWFDGLATVRVLFRVVDAAVVDFYVSAGATVPFPWYLGSEVMFAGLGGIEFGFRSAPNLAWNIEFGVACSTQGTVQMAIGTGIHFYF